MKNPTLKLLKDRCADESGRWIWQQTTTGNGVPTININGHNVSVYRVAYCLHHGITVADLGADMIWPTTQQCDINPVTLMRGTCAEFHAWRKSQGRTKRSPAARAAITAAARARASTKTTPAILAEIHASDEPSHIVGARVGLSFQTVCKIRRGEIWKDAVPNASVFSIAPMAAREAVAA